MDRDSKVVLVTGGAKGLGRHLAQHFHGGRHRLIIFDHNPFESLPRADRDFLADYRRVDLADWSAVQKTVGAVLAEYGHVDILVNNAAMRMFKNLSEFTTTEIDRIMQVNLLTPIRLAHTLLPHMQTNGYGRIINIGSRSGIWGYARGSLYCSAKSALQVFTESVGRELVTQRGDVTMNVICPDAFRTLEGRNLRGADAILRKTVKLTDMIIGSRVNGKVFFVLRPRTRLDAVGHAFRRQLSWLLRH